MYIVTPRKWDGMDASSDFQKTLSYDWLSRSWRSVWGGASINKLPGFLMEYCASMALKSSLPWLLVSKNLTQSAQAAHANVLDNVKARSCWSRFRAHVVPVTLESI